MSRISCDSDDFLEIVRDYNEFAEKWAGRIRNIVVNNGSFPVCDIDDIVQELMTDFYKKDYLSIYDPAKGSKFSTFIYNFVSRSLLGKRDRYLRKVWSEGLSLNVTLEDGFSSFEETFAAEAEDFSFEFFDTCRAIYQQLLKEEVTSKVNDFPRLFSAIVEQLVYGVPEECVEELGEVEINKSGRYGINRKALAWKFDVSESGISVMLARLADVPVLREILGQ